MNNAEIEKVVRFSRDMMPMSPDAVTQLIVLARRRLRAAERWCEGNGCAKSQMDKTERKISALLRPYGYSAKFGGDPKGFAVSVILADGTVVPVPLS